MPDIKGFTATDYLARAELSQRGYEAAERQKAALLPYAIPEDQWQQYLAARARKGARRPRPGPPRPRQGAQPGRHPQRPAEVRSPRRSARRYRSHRSPARRDPQRRPLRRRLHRRLRSPAAGQRSAQVSETAASSSSSPDANSQAANIAGRRPVILVTVPDKKTGPPFLLVGANIQAQTGGVTRATIEGIFLYQDLGGYGSELRGNIKFGFLTQLDAEYYRRIHNTGLSGGFFLAPHAGLLRQPFYIFDNQHRVAERQLHAPPPAPTSAGPTRAFRSSASAVDTRTSAGTKSAPTASPTSSATANASASATSTTRRTAPSSRSTASAPPPTSATSSTPSDSPSAPQFTTQISLAHQIGNNIFIFATEGGTMFNRNVAQPFRFTLGGPLRLTASAIDEYRGTDYFLVKPAFLRRIAKLPAPLGQSIYLGAAYEAGQMRAPGLHTITRQDVYFGIVAETPLGVITLAPAIGDDGHRKFIFTLGKLF